MSSLIEIPASGADPSLLRGVFGCFPSGVAAVCGTGADGAPIGMAVSTFTPVSLEPPLVSICIQRTSGTWPLLRSAVHLGVSVLGDIHDVACRQLSAKSGDRFAGLDLLTTSRSAVLIGGASAWLECQFDSEIPAGDHIIALLRVRAVASTPDVAPLVFHSSRFRQLVAS